MRIFTTISELDGITACNPEDAMHINFVDENNLFVGYEVYLRLSEEVGWKIETEGKTLIVSYTNRPLFFVGQNVESLADAIEKANEYLKDYRFDKNYFDGGERRVGWAGTIVFDYGRFRLISDSREPLYLILENSHNGYYCHDFIFKDGDTILEKGEI